MEEESKNQRIAGRLVAQEINARVNQTVEYLHEHDEYPDLEAENYNIANDDETEPVIFEYWAISEWLGDRLKENKEIVFNMLDFTVWGRQTTGQSIALDGVIQKIAIDAGFHD